MVSNGKYARGDQASDGDDSSPSGRMTLRARSHLRRPDRLIYTIGLRRASPVAPAPASASAPAPPASQSSSSGSSGTGEGQHPSKRRKVAQGTAAEVGVNREEEIEGAEEGAPEEGRAEMEEEDLYSAMSPRPPTPDSAGPEEGEAQDGEVQEGEVREGEVEEEEEDMYAEPDTAVADEESLAYIRFYFGLDESTTREEVLRYLEANTSILAHIALDTRPHNLRHILERSPLRMRVGSRAYTENGELLIDSIRNIDWGSRLLDDFVDSVRRGGRSSLDRWDKSRRGRASLAAAPPTSSSLQARRRNQASLGRVRLSTRISSLMSRSGTTRGGRKVAYLRWPGWRAPTEPHPGDGLPPSADLDPPRVTGPVRPAGSGASAGRPVPPPRPPRRAGAPLPWAGAPPSAVPRPPSGTPPLPGPPSPSGTLPPPTSPPRPSGGLRQAGGPSSSGDPPPIGHPRPSGPRTSGPSRPTCPRPAGQPSADPLPPVATPHPSGPRPLTGPPRSTGPLPSAAGTPRPTGPGPTGPRPPAGTPPSTGPPPSTGTPRGTGSRPAGPRPRGPDPKPDPPS